MSYRFTDAIVRRPARSIVNGLRALDRGRPDVELFLAEHISYVGALERAGLRVAVLPETQALPDSVFVEDTAICLPDVKIILRPGAPTRLAEADSMAEVMTGLGYEFHRIADSGYVDGGDILTCDDEIFVGLSARTDQAGFDALKNLLSNWGYSVKAVRTPENVLHFKSDCSLLDSETILATSRLCTAECFASFRVLTLPEGEEGAANSVRVNDTLLVPDGFPATAEMLDRQGYSLKLLPVSQAALLDGGLSCMSLRFSSTQV